jgi:IS66 C-terminal element
MLLSVVNFMPVSVSLIQFFFLWKASHKKKNWLFFGDADAGERSAILYTIIESCRSRGIDPYAYLRDVLTRLPFMTNWQVKHVTPEGPGEIPIPCGGNRCIADHNRHSSRL